MRVKLDHPIKKPGIAGIGDTVIEEITLRMPTVKDMRGLSFVPPHDVTAFAVLISRVSGLPMTVVDQIAFPDWKVIGDAFNKLTEGKK
jgi:hypothetical protein